MAGAAHLFEEPGVLEAVARLVGDWFAGSGAAGEACCFSGRRYLGCEIDPVMARKAGDRIASTLPFHQGERP